jgi:hypothetical protein
LFLLSWQSGAQDTFSYLFSLVTSSLLSLKRHLLALEMGSGQEVA